MMRCKCTNWGVKEWSEFGLIKFLLNQGHFVNVLLLWSCQKETIIIVIYMQRYNGLKEYYE
jgi:hypothetical protein